MNKSNDNYSYDSPQYAISLGIRIQQNLHYWGHWYYYAKWQYLKDPNTDWAHFYTARHNLPSGEKIVDYHYCYYLGAQHQLWALGQNE